MTRKQSDDEKRTAHGKEWISGDDKKTDNLEQALEDSFPASDPPSMTQPKSKAGAPKSHKSVEEVAKTYGKPGS